MSRSPVRYTDQTSFTTVALMHGLDLTKRIELITQGLSNDVILEKKFREKILYLLLMSTDGWTPTVWNAPIAVESPMLQVFQLQP